MPLLKRKIGGVWVAIASDGSAEAHPDLAAHDTLGLATQAELDAIAAAKANTSHSHIDADLPAGIARDTEVTAAVDAHEAEADPHPGYLTPAEGNAAYEAAGAVATHAGAADPHAGYRLESVAITAADVAADVATQAELDAHINDTTAAHAASAVSFTPAGSIAATTVQAAIEEVANEASGTHPDLATHDTLGLATQSELDAVNAKVATVGNVVVKTGNYTLLLIDAGRTIEVDGAFTITIPAQASVAFLRGQWVRIVQKGAGIVTVTHTTPSLLVSRGSAFRTAGQYAVCEVYLSHTSPELWIMSGDIQV